MSSPFVDISLIGDKKLAETFRKMEFKAQKKVFRQAVREASKPILQKAKELVPVDTGNLRDSLKLRALPFRPGVIGVTVMTGKRSELGIAADDKHFYPAIIEYRHKSYLRAALDAEPNATRQRVADGIRKRLGELV
jgi:hypothetical protein